MKLTTPIVSDAEGFGQLTSAEFRPGSFKSVISSGQLTITGGSVSVDWVLTSFDLS